MDTALVFVKTDKGHEEIDKRTYRLNFKHRTALIQVDGEHTVGELLEKIPGDGSSILEDLLRDGFIASTNGKAAAVAAEPAREAPVAGVSEFNLETAKRNAVKAIESVLGPGGESFAVAIERCKTRSEFALQAQQTRTIIERVGGARKGAEFWTKIGL
ncbi:MAG: hypothetical protein ABI583_04920 [Betaproteobacteria bacterium]